MIICENAGVEKVIPVSGRLYRLLNVSATRLYIYCGGKSLCINLEGGTYASYMSADILVDVTDQYCLQKVK